MPNDFQTALTVLLIGMFTVFVVLFLVIYTAKAVIWLVNRQVNARERRQEHYPLAADAERSRRAAHLAVIVAAVTAATDGKGKIERIEWLD